MLCTILTPPSCADVGGNANGNASASTAARNQARFPLICRVSTFTVEGSGFSLCLGRKTSQGAPLLKRPLGRPNLDNSIRKGRARTRRLAGGGTGETLSRLPSPEFPFH